MNREIQQSLARALGIRLKNGCETTVGGSGCPSVACIVDHLHHRHEWECVRMTKTQQADASDYYGYAGKYFAPSCEKLPVAVAKIIAGPSGISDCDGDIPVEVFLRGIKPCRRDNFVARDL